MAKAYDRVSWSYLCILMRKMGFCEVWIDMIFRHISSNWYSLIVNGIRQDFFKSERGLTQGDPIYPSLFILCVEFLSKKLNDLNNRANFTGFYMNKHGPIINYLAFADDIILFSSGCRYSLVLLMQTLSKYESISGQQINKDKSVLAVAPNAQPEEVNRVMRITGINHKQFPIKYLGCPLYVGRKKISIFSEMIQKVVSKISGCQTKFLSTGGKVVLIKNVQMAIHTHLLAAIHPPKGVVVQIEKMLARFLWSGTIDKRKCHWAAWDSLCLPYNERGANIRNMQDICNDFTSKQWWNLRTGNSLWKMFCMSKYCQKSHPVIKNWYSGHSQSWHAMCLIKDSIDHHILWKVGRGDIAFWLDNWTDLSPLYKFLPAGTRPKNNKISEMIQQGQWMLEDWDRFLPEDVIECIHSFNTILQHDIPDRPIWNLSDQ
ncbi:uncharacterized protein LOC132612322 [Lycium barbarum]|uniref:uncharacterized protein LOC132612322 n=1 Tax=Lycium barbarum TaxID=112863 RepID=UPI00293E688A|nr:uncharacterized protein LOC132612322 [Lycium barbarum]